MTSLPTRLLGRKAPLEVFVVDDDAVARCPVVRRLRRQGARVTTFDTAEAALLLARGTQPDLLVIDLDLPGMTGFEAAEALSSDQACQQIPLLVVSRRDDERTRLAAFAVGAQAFLAKPCDLDELEAVTVWLLERRGPSAARERATALLRDAIEEARRGPLVRPRPHLPLLDG